MGFRYEFGRILRSMRCKIRPRSSLRSRLFFVQGADVVISRSLPSVQIEIVPRSPVVKASPGGRDRPDTRGIPAGPAAHPRHRFDAARLHQFDGHLRRGSGRAIPQRRPPYAGPGHLKNSNTGCEGYSGQNQQKDVTLAEQDRGQAWRRKWRGRLCRERLSAVKRSAIRERTRLTGLHCLRAADHLNEKTYAIQGRDPVSTRPRPSPIPIAPPHPYKIADGRLMKMGVCG
jgi:hypothetical protein